MMKNEMENEDTYLFLVQLCCFHVQCLEESLGRDINFCIHSTQLWEKKTIKERVVDK